MKTSPINLLKWPWLCLLFIPLLLMLIVDQPMPRPSAAVDQETPLAVIAAPDDPYYPLAEEIAAAEAAPLFSTLKEGLALSPQALVLVVSPDRLSDQESVRIGQELLAAGEFPALGFVTASTLEGARALWERRTQAGVGPVIEANALYPFASIFEGRISNMDQDPPTSQMMTPDSLREALSGAGYLAFTGHGGGTSWHLDEETRFATADLPEMTGAVVSAASCQTFRPWVEKSFLLGFADKGAAAYSGFVYSPMDGFIVGEYNGLPYRFTWPEFPIGMVARVQIEGSLQSYASVPFYFTLGDPRISLNASMPYRLKDEKRTDTEWTLTYQDAQAGIIPVRIAGGGDWSFVDVQGVGNAADGTRYYHKYLQTANLNGDKYILFMHKGGDFTLRLERQVPLWWRVLNPIMNALDETYIAAGMNGGGFMLLVPAIPIWIVVLVRKLRKPGFKRALLVGLIPALVLTLWRAGYAWLRLGETAVNSKPLYFEPLWYVGGLALAWVGAVLLLAPGSRGAKIFGLVLGVCFGLAPALFWVLAMTGYDVIFMINHVPAVYQGWSALAEFTAATFELPIFGILIALCGRLFKTDSQPGI